MHTGVDRCVEEPGTYVRHMAPLHLSIHADTRVHPGHTVLDILLVKASVILGAPSNESCTATSEEMHAVCTQDDNQSAMQAGNTHGGYDFKADSSAITPRA